MGTALIRIATPEDLNALCSMARRFVAETEFPITYSEAHARRTLWTVIHSAIALVWEGNETLGGAVIGQLEDDFTVEKLAYVSKFYIEKELRGLGVARELLSGFEAEVKRRGASLIYASATAGMGDRNELLYVRLFERQGYNVLGRVLIKDIR